MAAYHEYVFDQEKRELLGRFEQMYAAEGEKIFDSWHQEDQRDLSKIFAKSLLSQYCFSSILDLGCGKGAFTHGLKKRNNRVIAIDISETALQMARARYADIEFLRADLNHQSLAKIIPQGVELAVALETFSYLAHWEVVLQDLAALAGHLLVVLYLPENPIGFIKSEEQLLLAFSESFEIIQDIRMRSMKKIILFGKSKRR